MKKCMLIALITVFSLVSAGALCFADSRRGVANTSKKGSLLVFPLIRVGGDNDTIITLSNDYPGSVDMNCRYSVPNSGCACGAVFNFTLTNSQSISWRASTGRGVDNNFPPYVRGQYITNLAFPAGTGETAGELRCWAVNNHRESYPISWNWLSGTATIIEGTNQTWEYSAWRFAVGFQIPHNNNVSSNHILKLTGTPFAYDACPSSLLFNFVDQVAIPTQGPYPTNQADNHITLVPCKQDCVDTPPIQANFERYNEYENSLGTWACYDCNDNGTAFFDKSLAGSIASGGKFADPTVFIDLGTPGGMTIVTNTPNPDHCGAPYGVPFLGVISNRWASPTGPLSGETPTTHGRPQPELTIWNGSAEVNSGIEVEMTY